MRLLLIVIAIAPVFAADLAGFGIWKPADLKERDKALASKVGADNSARETLGDYGTHRVRMLYRVGESVPEQHDKIVDVWIVESGEGTLILGGKMLNPKPSNGPGEYLGSGIEGGERHAIGPGDVIHIPAKVPHGVLVPKGKHITYLNVRFPAE
jgi:mannose-6-phosphate isomerase-like protein (cupin superfamily)